MLLNKNACTNTKSRDGDLPIHLALQMKSDDNERHLKDILLLVNHGTEMNIQDKNGNTPIILAAKFCSVDIIRKMIENGAEVKYKEYQGNSALHNHMGMFNFIIKYFIFYTGQLRFEVIFLLKC